MSEEEDIEEDLAESVFEVRGRVVEMVLEHIPYETSAKLIKDCEAIEHFIMGTEPAKEAVIKPIK